MTGSPMADSEMLKGVIRLPRDFGADRGRRRCPARESSPVLINVSIAILGPRAASQNGCSASAARFDSPRLVDGLLGLTWGFQVVCGPQIWIDTPRGHHVAPTLHFQFA